MIGNNQKYLILNWKSNPIKSIEAVISQLENLEQFKHIKSIFFPPPMYLSSFSNYEKINLGSPIADNEPLGASTGSIGLELLKQATSVGHVIVGHAESRSRGQTQSLCEKITSRAVELGIKPIFCFGEDSNQSFDDILSQLDFLKDLPTEDVFLAYEPLWAIGASVKPSLEQIEKRVVKIRQYLEISDLKVLYGGSIDEKSFEPTLNSLFISGLLLGRMSHELDKIIEILRNYIK